MAEPVTWIVADMTTGEITERVTTSEIQPGCFVPSGDAHGCDGIGCDCECHDGQRKPRSYNYPVIMNLD